VAANQQLLSGWISVPSNMEQYASVFCASFLLAIFVTTTLNNIAKPFCLGLCALLLVTLLSSSKESFSLWNKFPLTEQLKNTLKQDAHSVAFSDIKAGLIYNLVYPKQHPTFFSYSQAYWGMAKDYVPKYLCAKKQIENDSALKETMQNVLDRIDVALRYETEDYYLNTLFRTQKNEPHFDLNSRPNVCPAQNLSYVASGGVLVAPR